MGDGLVYVATTLFTNNGNPRVASLMNAMRNNDSRLPLLYILEFQLPTENRFTSSTVGPLILQLLLVTLFYRYSVAVYLPQSLAQYSLDDISARHGRNLGHTGEEPTDEEICVEEKRQMRNYTLKHQDMRQFFRAGFRQVDDAAIVNNELEYFVFITPEGAPESILTEQQTLDLPIVGRSPPPN